MEIIVMSEQGSSINSVSVMDVRKSENCTYLSKYVCMIKIESPVLEVALKALAFIAYFITVVLPLSDLYVTLRGLCVTIRNRRSDKQKLPEIEQEITLKNFLKGYKINSTLLMSYVKKIVKLITIPKEKIYMLLRIAYSQEDSGNKKEAISTYEQAKEIAKSITNSKQKIDTLLEIAIGQGRSGNKKGAISTYEQVKEIAKTIITNSKDKMYTMYTLMRIASAQKNSGYKQEAISTLEEAKKIEKEIIKTIKNPHEKIRVLLEIANGQEGAISTYEQVKEIAKTIKSSNEKIYTLLRIAIAQKDFGNKKEAISTYEQAKEIAKTIKSSNEKLLIKHIDYLFNSPKTFCSQLTTYTKEEESFALQKERIFILINNAVNQEKSGNKTEGKRILEEAKIAIKTIIKPSDKIDSLVKLAQAHVQGGYKTEATTILKKAIAIESTLKCSYWKAEDLRCIAKIQAQNGNIAGSNTTLEVAIDTVDSLRVSSTTTEAKISLRQKISLLCEIARDMFVNEKNKSI